MFDNEINQPGGQVRRQDPLPERLYGSEALAFLEDGRVTLGRLRAKLEDAPESLHGPLLTYFFFLTELAGAETRIAVAELSRQVRGGAARPHAATWDPLLDALGRDPIISPVTAETTLNELSEKLWREHMRQD